MSKQHTPTEYEPFGEDWRKEVMKLSKSFIIENILKKQCIENIQLKSNHDRLVEALDHCIEIMQEMTAPDHLIETYGNAVMNYGNFLTELKA